MQMFPRISSNVMCKIIFSELGAEIYFDPFSIQRPRWLEYVNLGIRIGTIKNSISALKKRVSLIGHKLEGFSMLRLFEGELALPHIVRNSIRYNYKMQDDLLMRQL